eukprot:SAG11_NODE_2215_length_3680_cov_7.703993_4_plen_52_part_01
MRAERLGVGAGGGWGAAGNRIGEAGGVALATALESGQCRLTSLDLGCASALA